jgi:hypothetical protein
MLYIILCWIIYHFFDGVNDAQWYKPDNPMRAILIRFNKGNWYDGTGTYNNGWFWKADFWHFCKHMKILAAIISFVLTYFFRADLTWYNVPLLAWLCYWMPVFQLVCHVWLMKNWTWKTYILDVVVFWK